MTATAAKTPAEKVVAAFGGVNATARALHRVQPPHQHPIHWTAVSKWVNRKGQVPQRWHYLLLEAAVHEGVKLGVNDLLEKPGREAS